MSLTLQPPSNFDWTAAQSPVFTDFNTNLYNAISFKLNPPEYRAYGQTGVSLNAGVWNAIPMQAALEDNYGGWNSANGWYVAQAPGWYAASWIIGMATQTTVYTGLIGLLVNTSGTNQGVTQYLESWSIANVPGSWDCYDEIYLQAGDWVQPMFQHNFGGTPPTTGVISTNTQFALNWISL